MGSLISPICNALIVVNIRVCLFFGQFLLIPKVGGCGFKMILILIEGAQGGGPPTADA